MSCRVRHYRRNHPERHYFLASQEDFAHTELQFRGDDLHRVGRRATVLVAYVYYPEKGVLELSAPGNQSEGRSLQGAFCRGIVGLSDVPSRTSTQPHRLNTLFSPDIAFALEPDDNIASVTVVGVRLTCAFDPRIRILFERPNGETTSVREWINTTAVQLAPPLSYWNVSLVRFHVRFRDRSGSRGCHFTFTLADTGASSLKDNPMHQLL